MPKWLVAVLFVAACAPPPPAPPPRAPAALPAVSLADLDGRATTLDQLVAGKVAVVNLWATWCEACLEELDALSRLDARLRAHGALLVAVSEGEPRPKVAAFVRAHNLAWPQLVDEEFRLGDALGTKRVPTTIIVDKSGRVTHIGGALDPSLLEALRPLL
jgi:peroxiredoxin